MDDDSDSAAATTDRAARFERHRPRLFGIAYRMLGSVEDAEDAVQEAYLRWHDAPVDAVRSDEAWLVAVVTRLSIDRLRRATTEREAYVGRWLPEPIATAPTPAPDRQAELASDLSLAFLVLLERLAPEERAAFLLREVFDAGYDEIARALDKSEAACRQLVHRARERVGADRQRFDVPLEARERLVERFVAALGAGDQEALLELVGPDATWTSDGGGKVPATRRVVRGAARIVRLLLGLGRKRLATRYESIRLNGEPAIASYRDDRLGSTISLATDGERIVAFYSMRNPDKLRYATRAGEVPALAPAADVAAGASSR